MAHDTGPRRGCFPPTLFPGSSYHGYRDDLSPEQRAAAGKRDADTNITKLYHFGNSILVLMYRQVYV